MARATRAAAERLLQLHAGPEPLVLMNVWDGISAALVESLGFPAVATSSTCISNVDGVPDKTMTRSAMLARVAVISSAVRQIPLSADLESGYGKTIEDAAATARGALEAGAVGLNFEDWPGEGDEPLLDLGLQCERIRAMRATADGLGIPLVINARTEAMRLGPGTRDAQCDLAIERGRAFLAAGADCVFLPFVTEEEYIDRLVREIPGPINLLARASTPPVARLAELGVRRISNAAAGFRVALTAFRNAALELRDEGTYSFEGGDLLDWFQLTALVDRSTPEPTYDHLWRPRS